MRCPNCGTQNSTDAVYCKKCGVKLPDVDGMAFYSRKRGRTRKWALIAVVVLIGILVAAGVLALTGWNPFGASVRVFEEEGVVVRSVKGKLPGVELSRVDVPSVEAPEGLVPLQVFDVSVEGGEEVIIEFPLSAGADPERVVVGHLVEGKWEYQPSVIAGDRVVILASTFSEYGVFLVEPGLLPSTFAAEESEGEGAEGESEVVGEEVCSRVSRQSGDWEWKVEGDRCWASVELENVEPHEDIFQADVIIHNDLRVPVAVRPESDGVVSWGEFRGFAVEGDPGRGFYLPPRGEARFEDVLLWGQRAEWSVR